MRVCLARDGRVERTARVPAAALDRLDAPLRRLLRRWKAPRVDELIIGAKGAWAAAGRRAAAARLRPLARRTAVMSDVELLALACFGGAPAVLVVAGTGSVAVARPARGRLSRAGGMGPLLGDEGSAFWIGREALRRMPDVYGERLALRLAPLWSFRAPEAVRRAAALCPSVLARAASDGRARAIRREAAQHLAALAKDAARRAGLRPGRVAFHGGVFSDAGLRADFSAALGRDWRCVAAPSRPELAAAAWTWPVRKR